MTQRRKIQDYWRMVARAQKNTHKACRRSIDNFQQTLDFTQKSEARGRVEALAGSVSNLFSTNTETKEFFHALYEQDYRTKIAPTAQ